MDKQAVITRLSTLDLSRYPYFEIKELMGQRKNLRDLLFRHKF